MYDFNLLAHPLCRCVARGVFWAGDSRILLFYLLSLRWDCSMGALDIGVTLLFYPYLTMILQLAVLFGLRSSIAQHMVHLLYYMYRIPGWECWVIAKIVLLGSISSNSYNCPCNRCYYIQANSNSNFHATNNNLCPLRHCNQ